MRPVSCWLRASPRSCCAWKNLAEMAAWARAVHSGKEVACDGAWSGLLKSGMRDCGTKSWRAKRRLRAARVAVTTAWTSQRPGGHLGNQGRADPGRPARALLRGGQGHLLSALVAGAQGAGRALRRRLRDHRRGRGRLDPRRGGIMANLCGVRAIAPAWPRGNAKGMALEPRANIVA